MRAYFAFPACVAAVVGLFWALTLRTNLIPLVPEALGTNEKNSLLGIVIALVTGISSIIYFGLEQWLFHDKHYITNFTRAEKVLLTTDVKYGVRLTTDDMITYHSRFNWGPYAGLSFSTVFVLVGLIFTRDTNDVLDNDTKELAMIIGIAFLSVSAIMLSVVDLIHTNNLSPLVTIETRLRLIKRLLAIALLATALQVTCVGLFLSIIEYWLTIVSSLVGMLLIVFMAKNRRIPLAEIVADRGIPASLEEEVAESGRMWGRARVLESAPELKAARPNGPAH